MSETRLIFLDVDGVLNSRDWLERRPTKDEFAAEHGVSPEVYDHDRLIWSLRSVDPLAVARINRIVSACDARIVLSSSWRTMWALTRMNWILRRRGLSCDLLGATPCAWDWEGPKPDGVERWQRGHEIDAWLRLFAAPSRIVIIDDDADMAHLSDRLVQTDPSVGITDRDVDRAIELLRGTS